MCIFAYIHTHTHTHTHMIELAIILQTSVKSACLCLNIYNFPKTDDMLMTGRVET